MCKTKIVATLGPASQSREVIIELLKAGVNVVRLNFSHGSAEQHIQTAELVREIASDLHLNVGVLVDLQGPKIRIASFSDQGVYLEEGQTFYLDAQHPDDRGNKDRVGLDYPELIKDLKVGHTLLLDDGRIQLKVVELDVEGKWAKTEVLNQGKLTNRKGINLLGGGLSAPALTDKDKQDIFAAASLNADFIAVSFPRNGKDIHYARELVQQAGCNAHIVAKVERAEIVESDENMDDVISASDIIMVARGDLGVEIGDARLPNIQKRLIKRAKLAGKPVITATQMMESMIENPTPTRAEVLDVANAVMDGTDAVMLSAESAAGKYPVEAVKSMVRIAAGAEQDPYELLNHWDELEHLCKRVNQNQNNTGMVSSCQTKIDPNKSFAISSMISASNSNQALGVVILTKDGQTPLLMSRCMANSFVWALSDNLALLRKLSILRGVVPVAFDTSNLKHNALNEGIVELLADRALSLGIDSLLVAQLEGIENAGAINACWLMAIKNKKSNKENEELVA
ncbi:pyruvate kinase [Vibrio penaeicida]|uniref:Pyruvate kinase n=1 Tax=Vibrio penaeicida TaxID=104609 RepID=A0AAV5NLK6_9VIBR|nr:pyruvate kinase [Vibrio penaeicida]RTZ19556.1 pyruvate kinase [Vibrio penaeicida]GLQ71254.1 pyruvate kinase [Vibrio penaeicida]